MKQFCILILSELAAASLAAQKSPGPMPPVPVREKGGEYGPEKWTWEGVAIVADPVNHETLYIGGRCGGAEFGTLGNWALAADGKTWRSLETDRGAYPGGGDRYGSIRDKILSARQRAR